MSKIIYASNPEQFRWKNINPWSIFFHIIKYRELIISMTMQNFRSTYQASYLGIAWQFISPLIMLSLFYFVFGVILGGKFSNSAIESPLEYALALFVGLSFFNFLSQNINTAPSLMLSNQVYIKNLSFPLEVICITSVLNSIFTLFINLMITTILLLFTHQGLCFSSILTVFYLVCIFLMAMGFSWGLSALAVFLRDITALTSPLTLVLMFMCPIFYPASMVPSKLKWVIAANPVAVIIENVRGSLLYGVWPSTRSMAYVFLVSLCIAIIGYSSFMRSKDSFADVI